MRKHGLWCSRLSGAPLVADGAGYRGSTGRVDVDSAGAVMGASTQQMRGAVLGRLRADFSLVAMKAGCLRAFEALRGGGAAAVPPASAAALPGVGPVLAPPSSVAFAAPVVQAVAVSAGGGSGAGVLGGAG